MADETPSAHSTRWLETSRGILRYSELAPLLAERVLRIQERIEAGDYAAAPLDDNLIRTLLKDGRAFVVKMKNAAPKNPYVQRVTLDGKPVTRPFINYADIMAGKELVFEMGNQKKVFWK
ncbi:MAG: glycoside hydrolase domain-containing protein [Verrucomicrobiae bacterium]